MTRTVLITLVAVLLGTGAALARTWHVMPDSTGDAPTIKAAMDSATAGDTVLVACGTYYELDIDMTPGVDLVSETGQADCAIIDGFSRGRMLVCDGIDNTASVVGFTFRVGHTTGSYANGIGGSVHCRFSSLRFENCLLEGSEGPYGGAMGLVHSSPTLVNVSFVGNCAYIAGGLYCDSTSSPSLTNCFFDGNCEGAMSCRNSSSPMLVDCTFTGHGSLGNTLECLSNSSPTLESCTFTENDSRCPMYCAQESSPVLRNCVFSDNTGIECGGFWVGNHSNPVLTNCTFVRNDPGDGSGSVRCGANASPSLANCIIAYAVDGGAFSCDSDNCDAHLSCTNIYGNVGGDWEGCIAAQLERDGNFSASPSFCDLEGRDYHLCDASPCLPGNRPDIEACGLVGALGEGCICPPGVGEIITWGGLKALYR
jgi:hypothetical protein